MVQTIWLSQKQIGELYQKRKATISEHIKHIFEDGELDKNSVVRNFRTTPAFGFCAVIVMYFSANVFKVVDKLVFPNYNYIVKE